MATLKLTSGIIKQSSFDKTGDGFKYDAIHFSKGAYTAAKPYQLNSGTTITADPGAVITLVAGASYSNIVGNVLSGCTTAIGTLGTGTVSQHNMTVP